MPLSGMALRATLALCPRIIVIGHSALCRDATTRPPSSHHITPGYRRDFLEDYANVCARVVGISVFVAPTLGVAWLVLAVARAYDIAYSSTALTQRKPQMPTTTMHAPSNYYKGKSGEDYFAWQNQIGDLGGKLSARAYLPYMKPGARVLDFGCGGGWVLRNIPNVERNGVEINVAAHEQARINGVNVTATIEEQQGTFDVVMSNHCLEHVPFPIEALRKLRERLKDDGKLIIVLPLDDWRSQRDISPTIDHHLHTWTPLLLANTLKEAGYVPDKVTIRTKAWPPKKELFYRFLPEWGFDLVSSLFSRLRYRRELMAIARKA
ncbi:class I SAM-dependent methyltransferase [Sphingomonas sp. MA1305]|nr:class I SAM-dependent methyltransferase [Sphingomonas sp. MA1305]